ncbi:MAG: hypothetical protein PHQ00_00080 [Phycisphaerae bacterium]|nr:hypothetical protein [Phycisphaerae bacterium]
MKTKIHLFINDVYFKDIDSDTTYGTLNLDCDGNIFKKDGAVCDCYEDYFPFFLCYFRTPNIPITKVGEIVIGVMFCDDVCIDNGKIVKTNKEA